MLLQVPKPRRTVAPTIEPVTLDEAKKQLELAISDTDHDDHITLLIEQAREQWESDTQEYLLSQTWEIKFPVFNEFQFPHRPVSSITSVTYYDTGNSSQTLSTNVYELDTARSQLRLKYQQLFPATAARWDAVTVTYVLGNNTVASTVPSLPKQAMLLLIGYYFDSNRGENDRKYDLQAYEMLVARKLRETYP